MNNNIKLRDFDTIIHGEKIALISKTHCLCFSMYKKYYDEIIDNPLESNKFMNKILDITKEQRNINIQSSKTNIRTLYIMLTTECNMQCNFCALAKEEGLSNNLDFDSIQEKIIPIILKHGTRKVILTGGEPLLYKELYYIIDLINKNTNAEITLQSNGLIFYNTFKNKPKDKYFKDIEFSSSHMMKDKKELLLKNIQLAKQISQNIILTFLLDKSNIQDFYSLIDLSEKEGVSVLPRFVSNFGEANKNNLRIMNSLERMQIYLDILKYIQKNGYYDHPLVDGLIGNFYIQSSCGAYGNKLVIQPNGDVFTCQCLDKGEFFIRNLFCDSLKDIEDTWIRFNESQLSKELFHVDFKKICIECELKYLCGGTCGADDYYNNPNYKCALTKALIIFKLFYLDRSKGRKEILDKMIDFLSNKMSVFIEN